MESKKNENSINFEISKGEAERLREIYHSFASALAKTIVTQDFAAAHQFLAPWLQKEISTEDLQAQFEKELWSMNGYWDIEELIYPAEFTVDFNPCSLADLKVEYDWREPRRFSDELKDENFRQWMMIQFLPDENDERIEFDGWFDFWFVLAEVNGELKVGYFEFADVD